MQFTISRPVVYAHASAAELLAISKKCRRMEMRRAALSAGIAAIPLPGLDLLTDVSLLARLIDVINHAFSLTLCQLAQSQPKKKVIAFEATAGQLVLAALGFAEFRTIGKQHIEACSCSGRNIATNLML